MNSALAWAYKCRLIEEMAYRNNLVPVTDQLSAHAVMTSPVEMRSLAGSGLDALDEPGAVDIQTRFGLLALEAVVPRDLDQVPVEKIIEIRRRFAGQYDRWREYADAVGAELRDQLQEIESPAVLDAYLTDAVRRFATSPMEELKRGLAEVGVDAATAAVTSKFAVPPALAVAGLTQPHIAMAGGAAFGILNLRRTTRLKAQAKHAAPASYLLSVQEALSTQTLLSRIIAVMRRAAGVRG